jgi:hypothetical protein
VKSLVRIYKHNIYSIIGTLVFHILLVGAFLIAEMDIRHEIRENEVIVEIPVELLEQDKQTEAGMNERSGLVSNDPSAKENIEPEKSSTPGSQSKAKSESVKTDRFFDESYQKELEAAKQLVKDVDRQLTKKPVDITDIRMPVQVTDGMSKDEIKNVIHTGESNIEYFLENRYHLRMPVPVYLARGGGVVTVDIIVDREGRVIVVKSRQVSGNFDEQMVLYAGVAAERTLFNPDPAAPLQQKGTIRYTFIPQ